ncbi:MAG: hypothetical protein AB7R89_17590 [Dehalococcoidia bacterium]
MTLAERTISKDRRGVAPPISSLTRDFLDWVAGGPKTYADAMEAWRTSCPRLTIWEDALGDGLISLKHEPGMTMGETRVVITARGQRALGEVQTQ